MQGEEHTPDGSILEYRLTPSQRSDGTTFVVGSLRDITHLREAEDERIRLIEERQQTSRLASLGQLAGGVAHDFNNMLQIINGYSEIVLDQVKEPGPLRQDVQRIQETVDRAASLTRQLLAFSRQQMLAPQVLDLNEVVGNVSSMLRRLIGEDVQLSLVLSDHLYRIKADPRQLEQVLMNLAINARDAMPQGGRLTIETSAAEVDEEFARSHPPMPPGPYVRMLVTDTGQGMDQDTQSRIFEPFFTTKERGKGTGLGMAITYGIVKQSGGYICVQSRMDQGTAFEIYLPPAREAGPIVAPSPAEGVAKKGSETVLLVEDEDHVRTLMRRTLEAIGHTVIEASNGLDALQLAGRHPGRIDLLITDVILSGISGREVAERLATERDVKVLYVSGYTDDAILRQGVMTSRARLLQKPFTRETLATAVREVLDRG